MRIFSLLVFFSILFSSCSKDKEKLNQNPYLTNPIVNLNLNLNLPEYNSLKFPGNYVIAPQGIKGIIVYAVSESQYWAFDLTDPNHVPNDCSSMEIDGIIASCPCTTDSNQYNIVNFGQHMTNPDTHYPMQQYRAMRNGDYVTITN